MHKMYLHVCDWIISQALSYNPHPCQKLNRTISFQSIYICSMNVGPHSLCLLIDLAFSHRIFHALKLLPLHPSQSRSYLHCEGHSNLGLICVGIYSGRFRLYFRSIRPTTTPNTVATHTTPLVDFPLARSSLSRTSFLAFNVTPWYYWKNYVVLFNYYKQATKLHTDSPLGMDQISTHKLKCYKLHTEGPTCHETNLDPYTN